MPPPSSSGRRALPFVLTGAGLLIAAILYLLLAGPLASDRAAPETAAATDAKQAADRAISEAAMDPSQRKAIEAVIRDYLLENPEVISEAVEVLQRREARARLGSVRDQALKPFPGAVGGNPAGTVTLVEFTDYACGYCRASHAEVERLIRDFPQLKIVYRELPVIAPVSKEAAAMALAAAEQGRYKAFHDALFTGPPPTPASIEAAARKAGLDLARARRTAASDAVARELDGNIGLMQQLRIGGTPSFIVGDDLFEGAVGYDKLAAAVRKAAG